MVQLLDDIFNLAQYKTEVDRTQARMVYGISLVMIVLFIPYILFVPMAVGERLTYLERLPDEPALVFYSLAFFGIGILTLWGVSAGRLALSSWGPSWMWILGLYLDAIQTGIVNASNGVILLALILLAGLLKGGRGLLFGSVVALGALALGLAIRSELTLDMLPQYITNLDELKATGPSEFVGIGMQYIGASILIYLFLLHSRVRRKEGVSIAIQDRLLTADIITQIAQQVSQRSSLDELLSKIVQQINDRFDLIYHSQIFLIDDGGVVARLVASTGEVGKMLLARQHGLEVGSQSVIGRVTLLGVITVAHSSGQGQCSPQERIITGYCGGGGLPPACW